MIGIGNIVSLPEEKQVNLINEHYKNLCKETSFNIRNERGFSNSFASSSERELAKELAILKALKYTYEEPKQCLSDLLHKTNIDEASFLRPLLLALTCKRAINKDEYIKNAIANLISIFEEHYSNKISQDIEDAVYGIDDSQRFDYYDEIGC